MFRGVDTQKVYEQFLKKGFCKDHATEFYQDNAEECNQELSRKAMLFIRVGILDPIFFQKPAKCEKIKFLIKKTSCFSYNFTENDVPDEAYDNILVLDSVVVFTLCHLSKICCIGSLFQSSLRTQFEDAEKCFLQNLLHTERLTEADISHLNPLLQQNFAGENIDLIKVCYAAALLFVRNVCINLNIKSALQTVEKEMFCFSEEDVVDYMIIAGNSRRIHDYDHAMETYNLGLKNLPYSDELYHGRGIVNVDLQRLKAALMDFYISLMIKPACVLFMRICLLFNKLNRRKDVIEIAEFALRACKTKGCKDCMYVEYCKDDKVQLLSDILMKKEFCNGLSKQFASVKLPETDNSFPELVEDSDSTESESESGPVLVDASDSESTDTEMDSESIDARLVSESVDARLISESVDDKLITESIDAKLIAESTGSTIVSESTDAKVISESTDTRLKTKPEVNTPTRAKKQNANKQKRMSDKPSSQVEEKECLDITAINSYLKEASEALLEDCGYKALKIFHESLRPVIESPETYSSDPSEIICLKYSYGLAYYQSGEYDDLQKCITIFREIIEKPDWITFPPAYYVLGLAYRKLNRFKEALVYLENVQSILDRGINTKVYTWPGLKTVINETRSKILKDLVNDLIKDCENPPNPNAICRFPECQFKSIYYTDPDFKGYMSISCSEQCSLQYHVQCWKLIKTEKKLTDKELLEQQCLTPDCEGVIVKVQSIDKKGDISKEFLSDVKKVPKQKWAKWDKKVETKEKDKKKKRAHSSRSESREHSIESEKVLSQKNSNVTEASLPSLESSAPDSNQEENLPINQQNEQHKFLENFEISSSTSVSSEPVKEFPIINFTVPESPQSQNISEIHDAQPFENNSEYIASNCRRNNIYSYMADFLQCHGPLKIDDPILISEMATFPEDIRSVIEDCGGIGEFLKNDLRFAYVGDSYVCVVSDLGRAYAMHSSSSLPTGVDCLNSVEDSDFSKIRLFYNNEPYELNPDATEYKPAATSETMKNTNFKITRDSNSDISSNYNFATKTYELFPAPENNADNVQSFTDLYSSKIFDKKTDDNFNNSKPISLQVLSSEEIVPSNSKARKKLFEEFKPNLDTSISDLKKLSESNYNLKSEVIQTFQSVGENLLLLLNLFFSEDMEPHRQTLSSFIEPYAIKKNDNTTHTENNEDQISPSTPEYYAVLDEVKSVAHTLNIENDILNEQKNLLQDQLILAEQQKQSFASEVLNLKKKLQDQLVLAEQQKQEFISENSKLKKRLEDSAAQLETLKVEYSEKEKHLESGRKYLLESLTHAHETIAKQRKEIDLWKIEKNSILKTIEDLKVSLDVADEKLKKNIEETERNQAAIRNKLQSENTTLKARVLYADRQLLSFKKTEYLKRIDEKILQASQRRKELTDGLSMMCGNLNPVLETSMKSLAAELSTYESKLAAAKFSFSMKIDEQIKKIENGATLLNMEEIKMENIPDIPCWKNLLPSNSSNFDKLMNGSNQMPFNLGWNSGTLPGLTAAAIIPPATAVIPPAATVTPSLATASSPLVTVPPPVSAVNPPLNSAVISKTPGKSSNFENSKKGIIEKKSEPLDILNLNPDIQESYKSAMASINSFASTPLANSVPSLEDDLDKHFFNFKQPLTPAVSNSTVDTPKVPPGIRQPLLPTPPRQTLLPTPIQKSVYASSSVHSSNTSLDAMSFGGPDPVPKATSEHEKKTVSAGKNNYEKLLFRLKEQYPSYSQEELMSFVKEFRMQRQGKLSGLPIDTIISRIGEIIKTKKNLEKKAVDSKIQIKPNKVLINKKLVPDPKPKDPPPPSGARKKCPWNVESDSQKTWTASDICECVICYNEMEEGNSYKVQCGHVFHEECIRQWLNEKSDCPICRVHLLLPEDFPSLT